jgi:hypothetical protein
MAYFHATGAVSDPGKIGPYRDEEMKILADLQAEGVVKHAYRRSQGALSPTDTCSPPGGWTRQCGYSPE